MKILDEFCPNCGEVVNAEYSDGLKKDMFVEIYQCKNWKCNWSSWNILSSGEIIDKKRTKLIDKMLCQS